LGFFLLFYSKKFVFVKVRVWVFGGWGGGGGWWGCIPAGLLLEVMLCSVRDIVRRSEIKHCPPPRLCQQQCEMLYSLPQVGKIVLDSTASCPKTPEVGHLHSFRCETLQDTKLQRMPLQLRFILFNSSYM